MQQNMNSETLENVKAEYQAGKVAFERGQYRQSVEHLEKASNLVARNSRLGGEVQIWLVTAYEAAGQREEAIALCEQLKRHPHPEIDKQGRNLLYILQAPQLKRPAEWMTQIPDFGKIPDNNEQTRLNLRNTNSNPSPSPQPLPEDLSQINTKDNRFIWAALVVIGLTVGGLIWWSF